MSTFGRYTLVRRVGTGGMAEIWKAKAQGPAGFEKILAIKKVLPHLVEDGEFIDMFIEEAKLVAGLVHPNIVQVFDFGQVGKHDYFIAMEYVPGANLAMILKRITERGARLPMEVALFVAIEACKGLGYAHSKTDATGRELSIVHRDVSPQNILVSFSGEVKVTDFGIAKVESALTRTAEGHVRGKLAYMSPEQANTRSLDNRSDLFSLGIVLYELLTGRRLFYGTSSSEIFSKVTSFQVPGDEELAHVPFEVRSVVRTALQPDPDERFQDAIEMEHALMSALGPDGMVQARHALASIVQRLFDEERKLEMTSEIGAIPHAPDDSPTEAPVGFGAASGAQVALSSRPTEARVPTNPSGLTMVPSSVKPVHRADALPSAASAAPAPGPGAVTYALVLVGGVLALAAAAMLGARFIPDTVTTATPARTPIAVPTFTAAPATPVATAETTRPTPAPTPTATRASAVPVRTRVASAPTPAPTPIAVVEPVTRKGFLSVKAKPWVTIYVDGAKLRDEEPLRRHELKAGRHVLRVVNAHLKYDETRTIEIVPDRELDIFVDATTRQVTSKLK